jgi:hypothetical protein
MLRSWATVSWSMMRRAMTLGLRRDTAETLPGESPVRLTVEPSWIRDSQVSVNQGLATS